MTSDAWAKAQDAEARFHANKSYRAQERLQRAFYSGMLEISDVASTTSIIDIGCGPQSLLLDHHNADAELRGGRTAIDPLRFSDDDEQQYAKLRVQRVIAPVENLGLSEVLRHDEAWVYNCLQHVQDPWLVLERACFWSNVVRIFEWTDQPLSVVHIHSPSEQLIRRELTRAGFKPYRETSGRSRLVEKWDQTFYAGVWQR